jgi:hypothetical protein
MIFSREQLEGWSKLYDLGHRHFNGWNSVESENARSELDRQLKEAFDVDSPNGSTALFRAYKRKAKSAILEYLR